jgi:glycosyltransferase involved in cell wall biosynthesis
MGYGLPVVVTQVGGLTETVDGYDGAVLIPPGDTSSLREALLRVESLRGGKFVHPRTWNDTAETYTDFLRRLAEPRRLASNLEVEVEN